MSLCCSLLFFFFNDTATTEIYTLSLHDALPIFGLLDASAGRRHPSEVDAVLLGDLPGQRRRLHRSNRRSSRRSEEHTSELQSRLHLVCRLLLEKKKE